MAGPLAGIRIVEMAGIGPAPFAGMMLADHGADVIRICRPESEWNPADILLRSRQSIVLDIKKPHAADVARAVSCGWVGVGRGFSPGLGGAGGFCPVFFLKGPPAPLLGAKAGGG